jgi:hypothetical protein
LTDSNAKMNWLVEMTNSNWKQIRKFWKTNVAVGSWSTTNGQNLTEIGSGSRHQDGL